MYTGKMCCVWTTYPLKIMCIIKHIGHRVLLYHDQLKSVSSIYIDQGLSNSKLLFWHAESIYEAKTYRLMDNPIQRNNRRNWQWYGDTWRNFLFSFEDQTSKNFKNMKHKA